MTLRSLSRDGTRDGTNVLIWYESPGGRQTPRAAQVQCFVELRLPKSASTVAAGASAASVTADTRSAAATVPSAATAVDTAASGTAAVGSAPTPAAAAPAAAAAAPAAAAAATVAVTSAEGSEAPNEVLRLAVVKHYNTFTPRREASFIPNVALEARADDFRKGGKLYAVLLQCIACPMHVHRRKVTAEESSAVTF